MNYGRERANPCQRKTPGDQAGGTRIPLPVACHQPLGQRRVNHAVIAENTTLHPACAKKVLINQKYGADFPMAVTRTTTSHKDDDLDSLCSYGTVCTTKSCDHAYFARNGTTFSGRYRKYVVHCSSHSGETGEYLTPTERVKKQIRALKILLSEAKQELKKKDQDICRLMKELMELRLYKAALSDPEEVPGLTEDLNNAHDTGAEHKDTLGEGETIEDICANSESYIEDSEDSVSIQESVQSSPILLHNGKIAVDLPSSLTDSGHFEETASSSMLMSEARKDTEKKNKVLEKKDQDIFHPKKEVTELHLYEASLSGHEEIKRSGENINNGEDTDVKDEAVQGISANSESCENLQDSASRQGTVQTSPGLSLHSGKTAVDLPSSPTDSGHFEETASSSSANTKDSTSLQQTIKEHASSDVLEDRDSGKASICMWEKKLEELQRKHVIECEEHNDKVQKLLQNLSDSEERYYELRSDYEKVQGKITVLEKETESLRKSLEEQEERHKSVYLEMYTKGQEAARFEHADRVLEFAHRAPARVSVPELLQQLQITENELENIKAMYRKMVESQTGKSELDPVMTLQFLKSALYHFLTDKENYQGHLNAIENILGYSENERLNIQKAYRSHAKK